jgi:phage-related protein
MKHLIQNRLEVFFYRSDTGNEPVRDWLRGLPKEDKRVLGEDIKTVQFGWPLGMPLVRNLGDGLWEIRSTLKSNRIARTIFCMQRNTIILLHGFIKKSQKTPGESIGLALQRKKNLSGDH